jgi:hypothetical protein
MVPDDDDKRVKDLLDEATQADLARWFGLPSFEQLAEEQAAAPESAEDPEVAAVREQRAKAIAAVDVNLLERILDRVERRPEQLLEFEPLIDVHVDPEIAQFDQKMADNVATFADPREVEISDELKDDLKDCTPQALLRDLHRPETDFEKTFEVVDAAAEQRLDIVAEVATAMRTSWKLPPLSASPFVESRRLLDEARADRKKPWTEAVVGMPNRTVPE